MSQDCVVGFKGKDFSHTICLLARFRCHTFNILKVKEGRQGGGGAKPNKVRSEHGQKMETNDH